MGFAIDSTNFSVATNAVSTVSFGAGWRSLEVHQLDGAGSLTYRVDTTTNDPGILAADTWVLPANKGSYRVHDLDGDADETSAPAFHVQLRAGTAATYVYVVASA